MASAISAVAGVLSSLVRPEQRKTGPDDRTGFH
jgi:hypothetical protein